jgi:hypothetical protein
MKVETKGAATPAILTRQQMDQVRDLWATKDDGFALLLQKYRKATSKMPPRAHVPSLGQWQPHKKHLTDREKLWKSMDRGITVKTHCNTEHTAKCTQLKN